MWIRRSGCDSNAEDLKAHAQLQLAAFQQLRDIVFVDDLPRTALQGPAFHAEATRRAALAPETPGEDAVLGGGNGSFAGSQILHREGMMVRLRRDADQVAAQRAAVPDRRRMSTAGMTSSSWRW